jgi:hypothetical protein
MNERIKELWDKAAEDTMDYSWQSQTKFMERFAELIVKECALVANEHNEEAEGVHLGVGNAIKEHFGVE